MRKPAPRPVAPTPVSRILRAGAALVLAALTAPGCRSAAPGAAPARRVVVLELVLTEPLDDLRSRADLAVSPLATTWTKDSITGYVHNIGARPSPPTRVVLLDRRGNRLASQDIPTIPAPVDLVPRRIQFQFSPPPTDPAKYTIVVDPENGVPEITESNNRVEFQDVVSHQRRLEAMP